MAVNKAVEDGLVFGRTGQLARELERKRPGWTFLGRDRADLADPEGCAALVDDIRPGAVVIAAAWTAVDAAEENAGAAFRINADAPAAIAGAAARAGIPIIHVSTDYVFDGSGSTAWMPRDPTGPQGVYGASKLAGETGVRQAGGTHGILRTSWVFSEHGGNFVKTMLRVAETRTELSVVSDQIGGPTPAADLADACLRMSDHLAVHPGGTGTYHFSGAPDTNWSGFAREIFRLANRDVDVRDILTTDYPTPASRPLNSRLDCSTFTEIFGLERPDWRAGLRDVLRALGALSKDDLNGKEST